MSHIYLSGPNHIIQHDEWIFMIKAVRNLAIDILYDKYEIAECKYDVYVNNEYTMLQFDGPDISEELSYKSIMYPEFRIVNPMENITMQQVNWYEEEEIDTSEVTVFSTEFDNNYTTILSQTFGHTRTHENDLQQHLNMLSHDKERYYSCKYEISKRIIDNIMEVFINGMTNPAENLISDYIIFHLYPLIVYDESESQMYMYNDSEGWTLYNKNKLYTNLSRDIQLVFHNNADLIRYYGSIQNRRRLFLDIIDKIQVMCSIESMNKKYLIGMKNGIYDSQEGSFDKFCPEYLVYTTTRIPYSINTTGKDRLISILLKIFPDNDVLFMAIRWCGYLLEFGNPEKFLTVWHGASGNNGKSWIQRLVRETFGDYYHNIPTSLITSKRHSSNSATPDLASLENRLVVFFQEPDSIEKIHSGRVKELTGNDSIYVRQLYSKPKNIEVWAKMVIVANNNVETIGLDSALRRRFLVIPFESTFITKQEYNHRVANNLTTKNYYIREEIDHLCRILAPTFMELIVEQHGLYKKEGITIPDRIVRETTEFILSNNRTLKFIKSCIQYTVGEYSSLKMIYEQFKSWHRQFYPSKSVLSMEIFEAELIKESISIIDGDILENITCDFKSSY